MAIILITLDGPSGAGKGTIARLIADKLKLALLDSGALYRIAALAALNSAVALDDEKALAHLALSLNIEFRAENGKTQTLLSGKDISSEIREERVGAAASLIAPLPALRAALLQRQRDFAKAPGLVADGRDMGTVVFPEAQAKIFLTASAQERAERRVKQLEAAGQTADFSAVYRGIVERDERDQNRSSSPLLPAADAFILDSSNTPVDEVLHRALAFINSKLT